MFDCITDFVLRYRDQHRLLKLIAFQSILAALLSILVGLIMAKASNTIEEWFTNRLREFHTQLYLAHLAFDAKEADKDPALACPKEFELSPTAEKPNFDDVPQAVREAHGYYKRLIEDADWGSVRIYRVATETADTYAVRVTTDGDDGYLEVYGEDGTFLTAGRTYIEVIEWGSREWLRPQVGQHLPRELQDAPSRTLWGKPLAQ